MDSPIRIGYYKALVRRMLEEWWVKGNVTALDETHSPDFVAHTPNGEIEGRDAQKRRLATIVGMFSRRRLTIDDIIAENDRVVVRYSWEADHSGEGFGIPPTNHRITSRTIAIYRIADGRIVEEWEEHDRQGLSEQLQA